MGGEAKALAGGQRLFHLLCGPFGAGGWIAAHMGGCKAIKLGVIGGMDGHKLALQLGG